MPSSSLPIPGGLMFKRVLAPLDGSRFAEIAVPVALQLARRERGTVRLLLVHELRLNPVPMPDGSVLDPTQDEATLQSERSYLGKLLGRFEPNSQLSVSGDVVTGSPGLTIVAEAASWRADLVVMATHGRGPLSRFRLGSVAGYLIRHLSIPILLVRPRDDIDWSAADFAVRSIMVPLDFSPASEAILAPAAALATTYGATLELVHVVEPVLRPGPLPLGEFVPSVRDIDQRTRVTAHDSLEAIAGRLRDRGLEVNTTVLEGSTVAGTLTERISNTRPDVVAIATHGRGGLRRAMLGSVADKVIRASHQPVLVVRPEEG
jgi:nucleotide-binding universal stress UspA family protein